MVTNFISENINSGVGQGVLFSHNLSDRFECRFTTVKVYDSPSIMMKDMEGTTFGMWSAHGEGIVIFFIFVDVPFNQLFCSEFTHHD